MRWILGAQAQIHEIHAMLAAPYQRAKNHADVRCQPAIENLDRIQLGVRRFFADGAGDRRAVAEPIDGVIIFAGKRDTDGAGDFTHMRMAGMNPTIDDRYLHVRAAGPYGKTAIPA